MSDDPYDGRRTGVRRLRTATATVGAAALLGTGALTWSLAAGSTTAAADTATDTSSGSTTSDTTSDSTTDSAPTVESDDSGRADASSGGS